MELGEKLETIGGHKGASGEQKTIAQFFKASELKPEQVIEGMYKGTFESKKTKDYFFHVFEAKDGNVYAYGSSMALDANIKTLKDKQDASPNYLYASFKYEGKFPNKNNPKKTTHRFSGIDLYATNVPKTASTAAPGQEKNAPIGADDITF